MFFFNSHWLIVSSFVILVDNDPHFIVSFNGSKEAVCFDITGKIGDVYQLLYDKKSGNATNTMLYSNKHAITQYCRGGCDMYVALPGIVAEDGVYIALLCIVGKSAMRILPHPAYGRSSSVHGEIKIYSIDKY